MRRVLVVAASAMLLCSAAPVRASELITPVAATAQSSYFVANQDDRRAQHAIDGAGMAPVGPVTATSVCLSNPNGCMWLSGGNTDTWITFDLGSVQTVVGFRLWNYNEGGAFTGRGIKDCMIYAGADMLPDGAALDAAGAAWGTLVAEMALAEAAGRPTYAGENYFFPAPVTTRYVQILVTSNFGTADGHTGISEIRFIPMARILDFGTDVARSSATITPAADNAAAIVWTVPFGTDLQTLAPTLGLSSGACEPPSGSLPHPSFAYGPVTYTVTDRATDPDTVNTYTVSVTVAPPSSACDLESFAPNLAGSRASIIATGPASGDLVVNVPEGTTEAQFAGLAPALKLSPGATCAVPTPALSSPGPVHYVVTAQDGVTSKDYTATVRFDAEAYRLFVVKTAAQGLSTSDYDYLSLVPVSKHLNNGVPAILAVSSEGDLNDDIYVRDYLRRYRPSAISTVGFRAEIAGLPSSSIVAEGPLELSVRMATDYWASSEAVVLVGDAVDEATYPDVLQASALAAALDAPLIYDSPAKRQVVGDAIEAHPFR